MVLIHYTGTTKTFILLAIQQVVVNTLELADSASISNINATVGLYNYVHSFSDYNMSTAKENEF